MGITSDVERWSQSQAIAKVEVTTCNVKITGLLLSNKDSYLIQ